MPLATPKRLKTSEGYRRSRKQEREVASRLGGKATPASGAGAIKGDVRVRGVARIECKTTSRKSFSVTREMIDKIENAAVAAGELPALVIEFLDRAGKPSGSVLVMPEWAVDLFANAAKSNKQIKPT